jgi:hypothetical protein
LYGAKVVLPKEIKHRSFRIAAEAPTCPSEAEEKDLLEPHMLKAVDNLQKYQDETKAWRDLKVKLWKLDIGDLVLLRSPCIENTGELEDKWVGPYVVVEKSRPDAYHLTDTQGKMLEHSWNADSLHRLFI